MEIPDSDADGAWNEALEHYWQPFLELCFPIVAAGIDWRRPFEFLDQELQEVVRDAGSGRRYVDKLAKVVRNDATEQWVLVHVEVQSTPDPGLPARMYQYHQRLADRYPRPVASLAVLADDHPHWRPIAFEVELWGCRVRFEYPVCKLADLTDEALEQSDSPVAMVIAAQRAAQRTVRDPGNRQRMKMQLVRRLYERGFSRTDVLELFRLIDWQIPLPERQEIDFRRELVELEKEKIMPYVTSIERMGRQEGRVEAGRDAIRQALAARFGSVPDGIDEVLGGISELETLRSLLRLAVTVATPEAFQGAIRRDVPPPPPRDH